MAQPVLSCKGQEEKKKKITLIYLINSATLRYAWDGSRRNGLRGATFLTTWQRGNKVKRAKEPVETCHGFSFSFFFSSFLLLPPFFQFLLFPLLHLPKKGLRVGLRSSISTMYQRFCVFLCLLCLLFYLPLLDFCSFIPFILLCSTSFLYYLP